MTELAAANSTETAAEEPKVVGRPFEKGQSGNPKGRPKGIARQVRDRLGQVAHEGEDPSAALIDFFADVMANPANSVRDRMYAGNWLAERGWGKAPMFAPIEDDDPLDLSSERTNALAAAMDARIDEVAQRRAIREAGGAEGEAVPVADA